MEVAEEIEVNDALPKGAAAERHFNGVKVPRQLFEVLFSVRPDGVRSLEIYG